MRAIADDVHLICGFPPYAVNCYLVGDVLIDAMGRMDSRHILKELRGHEVSAHALTHAHADHQGSSHAVCEALDIPFWVHEADADAAEDPALILARQPDKVINKVMAKIFAGPGHPVDRMLTEGDVVAGFEVLHTPGHSAGHVVFWRASDRVLIAGDVLNTQNPLLTFPRGPRQPFDFFTPDPEENRRSLRRLGDLEPAVVCVGHGPPWRDTARFVDFCRSV
jgi:glyoxylase-like metal-dependent hydrolase (beta-lactamase superfamily II)